MLHTSEAFTFELNNGELTVEVRENESTISYRAGGRFPDLTLYKPTPTDAFGGPRGARLKTSSTGNEGLSERDTQLYAQLLEYVAGDLETLENPDE